MKGTHRFSIVSIQRLAHMTNACRVELETAVQRYDPILLGPGAEAQESTFQSLKNRGTMPMHHTLVSPAMTFGCERRRKEPEHQTSGGEQHLI